MQPMKKYDLLIIAIVLEFIYLLRSIQAERRARRALQEGGVYAKT